MKINKSCDDRVGSYVMELTYGRNVSYIICWMDTSTTQIKQLCWKMEYVAVRWVQVKTNTEINYAREQIHQTQVTHIFVRFINTMAASNAALEYIMRMEYIVQNTLQ